MKHASLKMFLLFLTFNYKRANFYVRSIYNFRGPKDHFIKNRTEYIYKNLDSNFNEIKNKIPLRDVNCTIINE